MATDRGRIVAGAVLIATNAYTGAATPDLRRRILPVTSYMIATEPLPEERVRRLIPGGRMIVETRARHCYYRRSPDDRRILFGGRAALREFDPRIGAKTLYRLMCGLLPDLEGVRISHAWNGLVGFSRDHMPHVGRRGRVHFAIGLSGSGMAMAPYLGYRVANKVLGRAEGRTPFEDLRFDAVPFHWGLPLGIRLVDLYMRGVDRVQGSP